MNSRIKSDRTGVKSAVSNVKQDDRFVRRKCFKLLQSCHDGIHVAFRNNERDSVGRSRGFCRLSCRRIIRLSRFRLQCGRIRDRRLRCGRLCTRRAVRIAVVCTCSAAGDRYTHNNNWKQQNKNNKAEYPSRSVYAVIFESHCFSPFHLVFLFVLIFCRSCTAEDPLTVIRTSKPPIFTLLCQTYAQKSTIIPLNLCTKCEYFQ